MSGLGTMWMVARRELRERGRSKSFLITTIVTLVIVIGLVVLPEVIGGGTSEYQVGSMGEGNEAIIEAAELLGNAQDDPDAEPSVSITEVALESRDAAETGLEDGELDAVLIDGSELLVESVGGFGGSEIVGLLQRGAASVELESIVAEEGDVAADVIEVMTSDPLQTTTLSGGDPADETRGAVAYAGLLLLYIAVLIYGTTILYGVTEEKTNRVVEVLLSTIKPWQLLAGKILGIGLLGISQFAGTIVVALLTVRLTGIYEIPTLNAWSVVNLVVWFILGFLVFGVLFGAAGSLVSRMEDAQNVAFPMSLTAVVGFFVAITTLGDPDGTAAVIGTFIPLTAPFVVPVRAALDAIPPWQYAAALVITSASIVGLVLVTGRIYAGGLLRYGGRVKIREAWRSAAE